LTLVGLVVCVAWAHRQILLGKREQEAKESGATSAHTAPVLNLAIMRTAPIAAGMALIVLLQVANMGLAVVYPMAIEPGLRISAFTSSLMLMVPLLISQCFALCAGTLFDRFGAKATVLGGISALIIGFVLLAFAKVSMGALVVAVFATVAFVGVAFALPTIEARMFSLVSPEYIPDVVSGAQTSMQVGGALGTTITMGIFSASFAAHTAGVPGGSAAVTSGQPYLSSFATVSIVLAIVYALSLGLAAVVVKGSKKPTTQR
jgi:DHA2 family lincomycin resistance protein-like MFS transporter